MIIFWTFYLLFNKFSFLNAELLLDEAKKYGYLGEYHTFEPSHGFIMGLQRVYSNSFAQKPKEIVFFVHGLSSNSACFGAGGKSSQAHLLADRGFDVWFFNARGNVASSKHRNLNEEDPEYWNFSWHEIGIIDVPQSIDYILRTTNQSNLNYVGHSQGGTVFAVMLGVYPEYNAKIKSAFLLAPGIYYTHSFSFIKFFTDPPLTNALNNLARASKLYGLRLNTDEWHTVIKIVLQITHPSVINFWMHFVIGPPSGNEDSVSDLSITNYDSSFTSPFANPQNTHNLLAMAALDTISAKQLLHFGQIFHSRKFEMFDYGPKNVDIYGSNKIPLYKLSNIKVPVNIVYGGNDALVTAADTRRLIKELGKNVVNQYFYKTWHHLDFIYPANVANELVPKMLKFYRMNK